MIKIGIVMDPIESINYKKDSTLAMMWEASKRGWELYYIEPKNLYFTQGEVFAHCFTIDVLQNPSRWYELKQAINLPLRELQVILMRKDPPFNLEYIYATYLLEHAEQHGVLVINKPQGLRDVNEKCYTTWFPQCCPPMLVTKNIKLLKQFFSEHQEIVCKPLDGMGGAGVLRLTYPDENASVIFEMLTQQETKTMMVQQYIPAVKAGDKRILVVDGKPIAHALVRIPAHGELRGNLAAGATGVAKPLTERDYWIVDQVKDKLLAKGLYFIGLDVIGDYLTEINVTSPTCIRELDEQCQMNISAIFFDAIEGYLSYS